MQEIKDENKQHRGRPACSRARSASKQLAMSRNRMMAEVADADVVLVNPTHVAVALRYEPGTGAPARRRQGRRGASPRGSAPRPPRSRVPMVEDIPLARALHAACELGQEIPAAPVHRRRPRARVRHGPAPARRRRRPAPRRPAAPRCPADDTTDHRSAARAARGGPARPPEHRRTDPRPTTAGDRDEEPVRRPDGRARSASSASSCCSSCRCRAAMLDVLIAVNITASLVILLTSMYVQAAARLLGVPVADPRAHPVPARPERRVARGSCCATATRAQVIDAFGHFVVGGSLVIGLVIFLILVVIQFVVITNGAGRVAEVGARFTLDAMPGKQMAIDADLNSGLIDEDTARQRRADVAAEADFYGAMDGGSKFVKGDAIAGIIITVINLRRRLRHRHDADGHVRRRGARAVQPADHRRRPGHADPRAAAVGVHRHRRHPRDRRGRHGHGGAPSSSRQSPHRAADRRRRRHRARAAARACPSCRSSSSAARSCSSRAAGRAPPRPRRRPPSEAGAVTAARRARERTPPSSSSSRCACTPSRSCWRPTWSTWSAPGPDQDLLARVRGAAPQDRARPRASSCRRCAPATRVDLPRVHLRRADRRRRGRPRRGARAGGCSRSATTSSVAARHAPSSSRCSACPASGSRPSCGTPRRWPARRSSTGSRCSSRTSARSSTQNAAAPARPRGRPRAHRGRQAASTRRSSRSSCPACSRLGEVQRVLQGLLAEEVPIRDLGRIYEALTLRASVSTDPEGLVEAARAALGPALGRAVRAGRRAARRSRSTRCSSSSCSRRCARPTAARSCCVDPARARRGARRSCATPSRRPRASGRDGRAGRAPRPSGPALRRLVALGLPRLPVLSYTEVTGAGAADRDRRGW